MSLDRVTETWTGSKLDPQNRILKLRSAEHKLQSLSLLLWCVCWCHPPQHLFILLKWHQIFMRCISINYSTSGVKRRSEGGCSLRRWRRDLLHAQRRVSTFSQRLRSCGVSVGEARLCTQTSVTQTYCSCSSSSQHASCFPAAADAPKLRGVNWGESAEKNAASTFVSFKKLFPHRFKVLKIF